MKTRARESEAAQLIATASPAQGFDGDADNVTVGPWHGTGLTARRFPATTMTLKARIAAALTSLCLLISLYLPSRSRAVEFGRPRLYLLANADEGIYDTGADQEHRSDEEEYEGLNLMDCGLSLSFDMKPQTNTRTDRINRMTRIIHRSFQQSKHGAQRFRP
jgi:hypothetical protein